MIQDAENEFEVVEIIDSKNNADSIASFKVSSILDQNPLGVFTGDEASVRETVNENATFIKFGDAMLGDVPAKSLTYQKAGLKGDDMVTNFWYTAGNNVYQITCSYSASTSHIYEPIFAAITDSYTVTAASVSGETDVESLNMVDVNYEGVSLSQLMNVSSDEVVALLGTPVIYDEYKLAYDDIEFYLDSGEITYAESFSPEKFALGGTPLAQNRSMLLTILGQPVNEGEGGSGYEMTFEQNGYMLTVATGDEDDIAWRITIAPNGEIGSQPITADKIDCKGVPLDMLLGAPYDDVISILGNPDQSNYGGEELIYGDVTIGIDMWSTDTPYLCTIRSNDLSNFTYNGQSLSDDYDKLTQIFGKEPNDARVFNDTYTMSYSWDYMGSSAWLTVEIPAAEGSSATTQVGVSWWNDVSGENSSASDETYQEPGNYINDSFEWVEAATGSPDSFGFPHVRGIVKNTSSKTYSYLQITFNLFDAAGNQVGTASAVIRNLKAGGTWKFDAIGSGDNISKFEFASIDGF